MKKVCTKCHALRPEIAFPKDKTKPSGLYSSCKDCYRKRIGAKKHRKLEIVRKGMELRYCSKCKKYLQKEFFYSNSARKDGLHHHCKKCAIRFSSSVSAILRGKTRRQKERIQIMKFYGGDVPCCKCCGEHITEFLCIDHINGGGGIQRKKLGNAGIYRWIIRNRYPKGFQILCHNCNLAKGFYGVCPHEYAPNTKKTIKRDA